VVGVVVEERGVCGGREAVGVEVEEPGCEGREVVGVEVEEPGYEGREGCSLVEGREGMGWLARLSRRWDVWV
jgi:hypothetical protein